MDEYIKALKQILAWSIWAMEDTQETKEARLNYIRDECFNQLKAYSEDDQVALLQNVKSLA